MRRLRGGRDEWLGALYDCHAAGLYRYAVMILADRDEAADAAAAGASAKGLVPIRTPKVVQLDAGPVPL